MNIFMEAAKHKIRFETSKGLLSVEDLWDLPLKTADETHPSLNQIAILVDRQIQESSTKNFVDDQPTADRDLIVCMDIIKAVIADRKADLAARAEAEENRKRKARIREILHMKQDESLAASSIEELEAELAKL